MGFNQSNRGGANNFDCPHCGFGRMGVMDSRPAGDQVVRRRRECDKCKRRVTTFERIEGARHPMRPTELAALGRAIQAAVFKVIGGGEDDG